MGTRTKQVAVARPSPSVAAQRLQAWPEGSLGVRQPRESPLPHPAPPPAPAQPCTPLPSRALGFVYTRLSLHGLHHHWHAHARLGCQAALCPSDGGSQGREHLPSAQGGWCAALAVQPGHRAPGHADSQPPLLPLLWPCPLCCGPHMVTVSPGPGPGVDCPRGRSRRCCSLDCVSTPVTKAEDPAVPEGLGAAARAPSSSRSGPHMLWTPAPHGSCRGSCLPERGLRSLSCPASGAWLLLQLPFLQDGGCHSESPGQRQHHQSLLEMQALGPPPGHGTQSPVSDGQPVP